VDMEHEQLRDHQRLNTDTADSIFEEIKGDIPFSLDSNNSFINCELNEEELFAPESDDELREDDPNMRIMERFQSFSVEDVLPFIPVLYDVNQAVDWSFVSDLIHAVCDKYTEMAYQIGLFNCIPEDTKRELMKAFLFRVEIDMDYLENEYKEKDGLYAEWIYDVVYLFTEIGPGIINELMPYEDTEEAYWLVKQKYEEMSRNKKGIFPSFYAEALFPYMMNLASKVSISEFLWCLEKTRMIDLGYPEKSSADLPFFDNSKKLDNYLAAVILYDRAENTEKRNSLIRELDIKVFAQDTIPSWNDPHSLYKFRFVCKMFDYKSEFVEGITDVAKEREEKARKAIKEPLGIDSYYALREAFSAWIDYSWTMRDFAGIKQIYEELYGFYKAFEECPDKYGVGEAILDDLKMLKEWLDLPISDNALKRLRGCSKDFSFDNLIKRDFPNGKEKCSKLIFGLEPDFEFNF
ncbi:MAG: hypothetical protein K5639_07920, partial [Eubacterium sp.]|nr:hypothetical protein [Eubacterium sp.]